jgi:ATP/maltotriose-dependent transcriptional regulator MalT
MSSAARPNSRPHTEAVRNALRITRDPAVAADLLFLEAWELYRPRDLGAILRAGQIRRANPTLAAEIQAELTALPRPPEVLPVA